MKIHTAELLDDALSGDLIWRKRELTVLKQMTESASIERQPVLLRAAVALLYAHWEGFIKGGSAAYVEFVALQRLRNRELAPHFLALSARKLLRGAEESTRIGPHLAIVDFFLSRLDDQSILPYKDAIRTEANLSSRVLQEIFAILGLDYTPYVMKAHLIDDALLHSRNTIAHGEFLMVDLERYKQVQEEVVNMLDLFRNQLTNAALLRAFRRLAA
jgi:hypothetical protein